MGYVGQVIEILSYGQVGDLIEFSFPIGFSHWALYGGDGHVIHFAVTDEGPLMRVFRRNLQTVFPMSGDILLGTTKIRRQLITEVNVPNGCTVKITNNRHACLKSSHEAIRRRLEKLLGQEVQYNLFSLNCEHFATFVRFGQAVCNQIPGKRNVECKEATEVFKKIVS